MSAKSNADAVRKYLTYHPTAEQALNLLEADAAQANALRVLNAEAVVVAEKAMSWAAGYPLKGQANEADKEAADDVYSAASALLQKVGSEEKWRLALCKALVDKGIDPDLAGELAINAKYDGDVSPDEMADTEISYMAEDS